MNRSTFRAWQKAHPNFITPHLVCFKILGNGYIIEMSSGTGFDHKPYYGVTLFGYKGKKVYPLVAENRNRSGSNRAAVKTYYLELIDIVSKWREI